MQLLLKRMPALDDAILGDFYIDGVFRYYSLEHAGVEIPIGTYDVQLTPSHRAELGTLWSPDVDHRLPLVLNVPHREGIRIHAMNTAIQSEGCIGIGKVVLGVSIQQSRSALEELIDLMKRAGPTSITIQPPQTPKAHLT